MERQSKWILVQKTKKYLILIIWEKTQSCGFESWLQRLWVGQLVEVFGSITSVSQTLQLQHWRKSQIILPLRERHLEDRRPFKWNSDAAASRVSVCFNLDLRNRGHHGRWQRRTATSESCIQLNLSKTIWLPQLGIRHRTAACSEPSHMGRVDWKAYCHIHANCVSVPDSTSS